MNAGSRITAILDTFYTFTYVFGNGLPLGSSSELDLHYRPGVSTRRGDFVEYNPLAFPMAWDGAEYHYFGSLNGGGTIDGVATSDDAFDNPSILPLLGRNFLFAQHKSYLIPTGIPTTSLTPDLAVLEGLGDGMAVVLNQSPYLGGPNPANRYSPPRDIRDLGALAPDQIGPFSAPTLTALTWDLMLTNMGIPAPGTPTQWNTIVANNLIRFFNLLSPTRAEGSNPSVVTDCVSIYTQLARLQESQRLGESSNLAASFPDSVLQPLTATYNIPWTTAANAIVPRFTINWGNEPNSLANPLPVTTFSMGQAVEINRYALDAGGVEQATLFYPNNSKGEVAYVIFSCSHDHTYNLSVSTVPAMPAGSSIEVVVDSLLEQPYLFSAGTSAPVSLVLAGGSSISLTGSNGNQVLLADPATTTAIGPERVSAWAPA